MANKHRRGTRGARKLRQKSAKSPRHEFCGPSCFFYENYMTTYDSLILYPPIFYNSCLQNPCKTTQVLLRLDYLSEGEVFSQDRHRELNWKSLARGQIRDIPAPWSFILASSLFFPYLALLGYAFHAPLLKSCRLIASRGDEHLMIFVVGIVTAPLRLSQQFSCLKLRWLESWYWVIFKITFRLTKNHYKKHHFNKLKAKIVSNIPLEFTCYTNPNGNLKPILMVEEEMGKKFKTRGQNVSSNYYSILIESSYKWFPCWIYHGNRSYISFNPSCHDVISLFIF